MFDHYDPSASIHMTGPATITLVYTTQYYLNVISPYDTPGGTGWYDEGTTTYATLVTGTVDITPGWVRATSLVSHGISVTASSYPPRTRL